MYFRHVLSLSLSLSLSPYLVMKTGKAADVLQQGVLLDTMLTYYEGGAEKTKSASEVGSTKKRVESSAWSTARLDSVLVK